MKTQVLISQHEIKKRVEELANQIKDDYQNNSIVLLGVLDGSFIFLADVVRTLWNTGITNCEVEFIGITSYSGTESSRKPRITKDLKTDIKDKNVLVVEDIADTGHTLIFLQNLLKERKPASLKTMVLLSKPSRREVDVQIEYVGFEIENKWVMGYGLDTDGYGRGLNEIHEKID